MREPRTKKDAHAAAGLCSFFFRFRASFPPSLPPDQRLRTIIETSDFQFSHTTEQCFFSSTFFVFFDREMKKKREREKEKEKRKTLQTKDSQPKTTSSVFQRLNSVFFY